MSKKKNSTRPRKNKAIIGVAIAVAIAIGIVATFSIQMPKTTNTDESKTSDPRTVFWSHVHGLGINPADRSVLYIATHGDFYVSINRSPPVKVDKQRADYMAFNAPTSHGVPLYASGHPSTGGNTGLIKSSDGGVTWEKVSNVLEPPVDFHAMSVGKSEPNVIIGFDSGARGLFKSKDAGNTWETLPYPDYVTALAISPNDSNRIFAGVAGNQKGIFQSIDGGQTWSMLNAYKGLTILALSFDEDGVLYASTSEIGLARSKDLGSTWENIKRPDLTILNITVDSVNKIIYLGGYSAGGFQEVHYSKDDGKSWELIATNKEL